MFRSIAIFFVLFNSAFCVATSDQIILFDRSHGQNSAHIKLKKIADDIGAHIVENESTLTSKALKNVSLLYISGPVQSFSEIEKKSIVNFLKKGGSLFLVMDEERRQSLGQTEVNDIILPFSIMLTGDTPYLHNTGARTLKGRVNTESWELPFSGGRSVAGGIPFAYQIDKNGRKGFPFAAYKQLTNGGRIVVMGEGMATLFLGSKDGDRMSGVNRNPKKTRYWGKDSYIFMEEVLSWLLKNQIRIEA